MRYARRRVRCTTIATASVLAAFALAASNAMAQQRGGANVGLGTFSNMAGVHGKLGQANNPGFDRRRRSFFSAFAATFTDPYWGYSGWNSGTGYVPTCGDAATPCDNGAGARWDDNNHSPAINRGTYLTGQPSARIIEVSPREDSERERAWLQRCEPRLTFDEDGIPHYAYNGKPGCSSGQWTD
jgi:hypothetical protein